MPDGLVPIPGVAGSTRSVLRLAGVSKRFGAIVALDGISFEANAGEILGVIGRSGSGKSTLVRCLNGLERPDAGSVTFEGRDIARLPEHELQAIRRRCGMIFQHFNILSAKTVAENVALPLKIACVPQPRRAARVAELLDLVGLSAKASAYPAQLSGGQKQRVGIARALATSPPLLLCDEATSALDPETTRSILALLRDINRDLHVTIVFVTHDIGMLAGFADRLLVLDCGRVVEHGHAAAIFADPRAAVTISLLDALPRLPRSPAEAPHV